ncbi:MAG: hypothetical protein NXH91_02060 [Phyllobacteriaceae bacterium]|jgi:hypothetical protein|nr:hypothetical protein [Phyllobacteriaceae bacterium]
MMTQERPFSGLRLGVSASETVAERGYGLTSRELNRAIRQVSQAVLAQGGRLVFGHDWRSHGVMEEILDFAISYKPVAPIGEYDGPLVTNYIAWPDRTKVSKDDLAQYDKVLQIVEADEETLRRLGRDAVDTEDRAARAGALTLMRRQMTEMCDARLCFGGKSSGSAGRFAGVAEEAALSLEFRRPLYVTSLFGGASEQVVNAIVSREIVDMPAFRPDPAVRDALAAFDPVAGDAVSPEIFARFGVEGLSEINRLSDDENLRLFGARHLGEVIGLLLVGLARVRAEKI